MLHNISIHTSAREVTLHLSQFHSCYLFQSTLLQGKWRIKALKSFSDVISIHTSAREVTGDARWRMQRHGYFNPHFRKGSDGWKSFYKTTTSEFQSTLPQGKWPFQPWRVVTIRYISIHTSAREVTTAGWSAGDSRGFQSTLPQGKWPTVVSETVRQKGFQSTLPQGKWPDSRHSRPWTISFQSTLPQGKWRRTVQNGGAACQFQSTLPQGKWRRYRVELVGSMAISIHTSAREVTSWSCPD